MTLNLEIIPYLVPYGASFSIALYVGLFAWTKHQVAGHRIFATLNFVQAMWILGNIFELISVNLATKTFWDDVQFIPAVLIAPTIVFFALAYTKHPLRFKSWFQVVILALPLILILLMFTNSLHHLIRTETYLVDTHPFGTVDYEFGISYWLLAVTSYATIFLAAWFIIQFLRSTKVIYRFQGLLFIIGIFTPLFGTLIPLFTDWTIAGQRDMSPFAFGIGNLIIAWAILRFKFFDLVPIARELVIENMQDMVIVVDSQQRLVDFNRAAQANIDQLNSKVIGQPITTILPQWSEFIDQLRDFDDLNTEITIPTQDKKHYFYLQIASLTDHKKQPLGKLVIMRDVTQAKEAEVEIQERTHQLEIANQRLKELSRTKDEFVSNVSHELRTPITNLKLTYELMQLKPDKNEIYLGRLQRETDRLALTIDDLLRLSRFDQGRVDFDMIEVDLDELCREYVEDRHTLAKGKNIKMTYIPTENLAPITADRGFIGQVLSILLTNAINYTPENGTITVTTSAKENGNTQYMGFAVIDSGPGISPAEQDKVFQRFYRGSTASQSKVPGTGLGLAIAQEIVGYHHGQIEVESQGVPGEGTTFQVWLPANVEVKVLA